MVFPAKYRRVVIDANVDDVLKEVCLDIEKRYQMKFLEIGTDKDHVHFLVQSVPAYSVNNKKPHSARNLQALSTGEAATMGRRVLDRRIFRKYGGETR